MQQVTSSSIPNADQKKIKKFNTSRHNIAQKQTSKPFPRLKSNHDSQLPETTQNKIQIKPRSSMAKRPASSKHKQTTNSLATTSSGKSETEVKSMIENVFLRSKPVKQFIAEQNLDQNEALQGLLNNQLFTLSLVGVVSSTAKEEANVQIEKAIKHRLEKKIMMEEQIERCEKMETRIGSLIEKRLQTLSKFL